MVNEASQISSNGPEHIMALGRQAEACATRVRRFRRVSRNLSKRRYSLVGEIPIGLGFVPRGDSKLLTLPGTDISSATQKGFPHLHVTVDHVYDFERRRISSAWFGAKFRRKSEAMQNGGSSA